MGVCPKRGRRSREIWKQGAEAGIEPGFSRKEHTMKSITRIFEAMLSRDATQTWTPGKSEDATTAWGWTGAPEGAWGWTG